MKQILFTIFLLSLVSASRGQKTASPPKEVNPYAATDALALQLPDSMSGSTSQIATYIMANFPTDSEKVRAIFIWVVSNLQYDIDNMFAINFYEKKEEKIAKALKTRKGICENYAAIFSDVCLKSGLNAYVVTGYTKQNGVADYIPHAWCAGQVNGAWFLFDPTWGSGYAYNGKFVKKINNAYYKVVPERLIRSHMPFDPMWQFLNYPVSNQEFYEDRVLENKSKPYFSYTDSIAAYEKLDEVDKYRATARRVEANGIKNSLLYNELEFLKREIESSKVDFYNSAVADFNDGVNNFNDFINYQNKQFKPIKPDADIQAMFDAAYNKITSAKNKLNQIADPGPTISAMISSFHRSIDDVMPHMQEQKEWLSKYFSKGKLGRATMFTKYTWMGVPLN